MLRAHFSSLEPSCLSEKVPLCGSSLLTSSPSCLISKHSPSVTSFATLAPTSRQTDFCLSAVSKNFFLFTSPCLFLLTPSYFSLSLSFTHAHAHTHVEFMDTNLHYLSFSITNVHKAHISSSDGARLSGQMPFQWKHALGRHIYEHQEDA